MKNRLRQALVERQLTLGAWMQIGHSAVAEVLARASFDWVCVDLEHGAIDLETMAGIFRTLERFECVPVARLPMNDPIWIRRTLDAGARGLIIPMVSSAAEAQAAVRHAKYPPMGIRGFGYSRANLHGIDFEAYIQSANDEIPMIMQLEHRDALGELDQILQVPGVDGSLIGPLDLSGSMGITGQLTHPDMLAALEQHRSACRRHRVSAGLHIVRPTEQSIRETVELGYTHIILGVDGMLLYDAARSCLQAAGR